jgi:uncharacterized protein
LQGQVNIDAIYLKPFIKIGITSTTCLYASIIALLFITSGQNKIFKALQAVGKMTLTNYLLVSAVLIVMLYGVGFGMLGDLPMHIIWLYALMWLIFEIVFSTYWLHYFQIWTN